MPQDIRRFDAVAPLDGLHENLATEPPSLTARHPLFGPCYGAVVVPVRRTVGSEFLQLTDPDPANWMAWDPRHLRHDNGVWCAQVFLPALALRVWPSVTEALLVLFLVAHVSRTYRNPLTAGGQPVAPWPTNEEAALAVTAALIGQNTTPGQLEAGLFRHLPVPGRAPGNTQRLANAPTERYAAGVFHLGACLYPGGVLDRSATPSLDGLMSHANRPGPPDQVLARLGKRRTELAKLSQDGTYPPMVLAGDQIYLDATAGLLDPSTGGMGMSYGLARRYDDMAANPWRIRALQHTEPWTLMDDHEISDNWQPSADRKRNRSRSELMFKGRWWFIMRQRHGEELRAPNGERRLWLPDGHLLGYPLFVGDTRSERSCRQLTDAEPNIMGIDQMDALKLWLEKDREKPLRFIATSSLLLPRRLSVNANDGTPQQDAASTLRADSWDGYPDSRHQLLAHIADKDIGGCVFLSGDEHIGCVARAKVKRWSCGQVTAEAVLWSIHAGGLYAPFPFANSVADDFAEAETFCFVVNGHHYTCEVTAWFPSASLGDSVVEVSIGPDSPPRLCVSYLGIDNRTEICPPCHW